MQITPDQIRAARAMLRMSEAELAEQAHMSQPTLSWIESQDGSDEMDASVLDAVGRVLEDAGVEFIPWGVRKRPPLTLEQQRMYDDLLAISKRSAERLKGVQLLTDDDLYDENGLPA